MGDVGGKGSWVGVGGDEEVDSGYIKSEVQVECQVGSRIYKSRL